MTKCDDVASIFVALAELRARQQAKFVEVESVPSFVFTVDHGVVDALTKTRHLYPERADQAGQALTDIVVLGRAYRMFVNVTVACSFAEAFGELWPVFVANQPDEIRQQLKGINQS